LYITDEIKGKTMTEKQNKNSNIGVYIVFGMLAGTIIGILIFPDKLVISGSIGMCGGIILGATAQILTKKTQTSD
jgi:F0F1-type ATP synthase assembly protein I